MSERIEEHWAYQPARMIERVRMLERKVRQQMEVSERNVSRYRKQADYYRGRRDEAKKLRQIIRRQFALLFGIHRGRKNRKQEETHVEDGKAVSRGQSVEEAARASLDRKLASRRRAV